MKLEQSLYHLHAFQVLTMYRYEQCQSYALDIQPIFRVTHLQCPYQYQVESVCRVKGIGQIVIPT